MHNRLVVLLADDLAPRLRPRYYVSIEERTYSVSTGELVFAGRGDVAVVGPSSAESQQAEDMAAGPEFNLPLQPGDEEPQVDLNRLLHDLYDRAGYDLRIDYRAEPEPPFEGDDRQWADELLHKAGLR